MRKTKKLNQKLSQLNRIISKGNLKEYDHNIESLQGCFMHLGLFTSILLISTIGTLLANHLFVIGGIFFIVFIVMSTLFLTLNKNFEHKKSDYIFSEINSIALSNKEEELKKHILLYSRKPDQEHKDFLAYFISNNFAPLFRYEFKDNFIDKGTNLIIENNYYIYQNNDKLKVKIMYNKYDLNSNQGLIDWYKLSFKNLQFKIDNLLEVKQKLDYFEKNKFIFDKPDLNDNEKELLIILNKIKLYLIQIALKTYNGEECTYKKDNVIAINKNMLSKEIKKEVINE